MSRAEEGREAHRTIAAQPTHAGAQRPTSSVRRSALRSLFGRLAVRVLPNLRACAASLWPPRSTAGPRPAGPAPAAGIVLGSIACEEDAQVTRRVDRRFGRRVELCARFVAVHPRLRRRGCGQAERTRERRGRRAMARRRGRAATRSACRPDRPGRRSRPALRARSRARSRRRLSSSPVPSPREAPRGR